MALTTARNTRLMAGGPFPQVLSYPVAASTKIYQGALVALSGGYLVPASADPALVVIGRAEETVECGTTAGAVSCEVSQGVHLFGNSATTDALSQADVGQACYAVDDETVARTSASGTRPVAGVVVQVDTAGVWVRTIAAPQPHPGDVHLVAAADLRQKQFYAIKVDSAGKAALAGAGELACGILQNAPNANQIAIVRTSGISQAVVGDAVANGAAVASNAAAKIVTATAGKTNTSDAGAASDPLIGSHVLGIALVGGDEADDLATILITHSGAVPTTAA